MSIQRPTLYNIGLLKHYIELTTPIQNIIVSMVAGAKEHIKVLECVGPMEYPSEGDFIGGTTLLNSGIVSRPCFIFVIP